MNAKHFFSIRILGLPLLLSAFMGFTLRAGEYRFIHMDKENSGLSYNGIQTIFQDSRGYVWVGTQKGLNRHDGVRFKSYTKEVLGLESDMVSALCEDVAGNIWIGTNDGICVYEYASDRFVPLAVYGGCDPILGKVFVTRSDAKGNIWIGTRDHGLYVYDFGKRSLEQVPLVTKPESDMVYLLETDNRDGMYISLYLDNIYYRSQNGEISPVRLENPSCFIGDNIEGMVLLGGNNLYLASKRHGLCRVNVSTGEMAELYLLPRGHRPMHLSVSEDRYLWMSTSCGLLKYDTLSGQADLMTSVKDDPFSISGDFVTRTIVDDGGNIWLGTLHNGVSFSAPYQEHFHKVYKTSGGESLRGMMVRNFAEDNRHQVWVATEMAGLYCYDPVSGDCKKYKSSGSLPQFITSLAADGDFLWLGGQNGVYRMSIHSGAIRTYSDFGIDSFGGDNRVITIFRSSASDLYVATTIGIMRYDRVSDSFSLIPELSSLPVERMDEDASGILWIASFSMGAYAFDPSQGKVVGHYPLSGMTSSVCVDRDNDIWVVGFSEGFYRFDRDTGAFLHISRKNLPLLPTDIFFGALDDGKGNLWMSSDCGLIEYGKREGSVKVFTIEDGLLDNEFKKPHLKLSDGSMLFGSENGFIHFFPKEMGRESRDVRVAISDRMVEGKSVSPGDGSQPNPDAASRIVFSPKQSSFGFNFSTPGFPSSTYGRLLCRLKGYDKEWEDITTNKSRSWYNIPAGSYTLQLQVVNSDAFSYKAHDDLQIVVEPTFWRSRWGVMLLLLMVILTGLLAFYLFWRRAMENSRKKQAEYERKREAELFNEKMTFFSNIVHEIKTPLTLIRTPLDNVLSREGLDATVRDELMTVENSTDYLDRLIRELLDFVRMEKHGYDLVIKTIDIVERLGFLCFNFAGMAKAKNVDLRYRHDTDCIWIEADEAALDKVLNNLLHNAVKYAVSKIDVHVYQKDGKVSVVIRNDGPVIPPEHREDIFKPFVQFSTDTRPYAQSFGIGLSVAKTLVELHKGTLYLDEDKSCTKFVLRLPARAGEGGKYRSPMENMEEYLKSSDAPIILIVEDNADLSDYLKSKLEGEFRVITVPSAEQALALVRKWNVNLIISDIALQQMSGVDLCKSLSSDFETSHIPIVVVSAISSDDTKIACMEAGASMYIEKPFNLNYLLSCIRGILDKRRDLRQSASRTIDGVMDLSRYKLPDADEAFLRRFEKVIQDNLGNSEFTNRQMEEQLFLSHSTLNRKVQALLDTSPNDYLRDRRLAVAAHLLESSESRINEICFAVGFNSPSYFSKCFKRRYGMLPAQYRQQFSNG